MAHVCHSQGIQVLMFQLVSSRFVASHGAAGVSVKRWALTSFLCCKLGCLQLREKAHVLPQPYTDNKEKDLMKLATRGGADSCLFKCSVCCLWFYYEGIWMCCVWILKALCELIAMSIDTLPALILVVVLWGGLISLGE